MTDDNIVPLLRDWYQAKAEEDFQKQKRLKIEAELVKVLEVPNEGSKTTRHTGYKVTVTQPISRKIDADLWFKVRDKMSPDLWPIKTKIEADPAGCKYLAEKEPKLWAKIAPAFTATPGKPGFKIEQVRDGD